MFIVLEGIDGSGKTTLCKSISKHLESRGYKTFVTSEPTDGPIGRLLSEGVPGADSSTEALLFVADRALHTVEMNRMLDDGYVVICDRYFASTLAYQAAVVDSPSMCWLMDINEPIIRQPDITFLMDIDPEEGLDRVGKRGALSRFEKLEYQKRVRRNYLDLAGHYGFRVIDASKGADEVASEVISALDDVMEGDHASV